jgi:phosphoribosylanthranilate isomerase
MFVKVCGITRLDDARHAIDRGATALGFIFWPRSPRYIEPARAAEIIAGLPSSVTPVGVFVNEPADGVRRIAATTGIGVVQLHGDESPAFADQVGLPIVRSMTLDAASTVMDAWPAGTALLLDAADRERRGGTGQRVDWPRAAAIARRRRLILAGGLTPENVADAIACVDPYGVDVSSGVEAAPGIKDAAKVARFLENARGAFERIGRVGPLRPADDIAGPAYRAGKQ